MNDPRIALGPALVARLVRELTDAETNALHEYAIGDGRAVGQLDPEVYIRRTSEWLARRFKLDSAVLN